MDQIKESSTWSINGDGHAVVRLVNSETDIAGFINSAMLPQNTEGETIMAVAGGLTVDLGEKFTSTSGWIKMEAGATDRKTVTSNKTDFVLGVSGAAGDYLKRIRYVVNTSAESRIVIKDGNPLAKFIGTTHASTASTTTVLNTVINPAAVAVDQYKDHLVKVSGVYRRILTHAAFSAGAVNQYTLDQALDVAPGTGVTFTIEDPDFVSEVLPVGTAVGADVIEIEDRSTGTGWRVSTGKGVVANCHGDYS